MQRQPGEGSRRAYVRPELTVHGDVGGVTRSVKQGVGERDNSVENPSYKTQ